MPIKNVIFDLGGVFLNLDFARTHAAFRALGTHKFDALWSPATQSALFENYEKGLMDHASFRQGLRQQLHLEHATDAALDQAWNAMLLDVPQERLTWLTQIGKQYRVFLLSNTNVMHLEHIHSHALPPNSRPRLADYFEHAYYSCDIHHRKPEPAAFTHVLQQHALVPRETLFVDDLPLNVEAARGLQLHACLLTPGMALKDVFA
jgi:FMN phosphatase YigB (HAD superfamily)